LANLGLILSESSTSRLSLKILKSPNPTLWWTIGGGIFFLAIVLYIPFLRDLFSFSFLHPIDLAICLGGGAICVFWFELLKLFDFPEMTIATDRVDRELVNKPRRMDIKFIRNFMVVFGLLSSVFDYLTFGALLLLLHAQPEQFRTGWFIESTISASLVVMVVRTRQSIFNSKPGKYLFWATVATVTTALIIPFTPLASLLGFQALPLQFLLVIGAIVTLYVVAAEAVKHLFYQLVNF
jgi:magnesium-transporting ATPase (P-type)